MVSTCMCTHACIKVTMHDVLYSSSGQPRNVTINITSPQRLTFSWSSPIDFDTRHGSVISYTITCSSELDQGINSVTLGETQEADIEGLLPHNSYNCCLSLQTTLANSSSVCQQVQTPQDGKLVHISNITGIAECMFEYYQHACTY